MKIKFVFWVLVPLLLGSCKIQDRRAPAQYEKTSVASRLVTGKVVRIVDGDTFTLLFPRGNFDTQVRLNGIDCPEKKQAFGEDAMQELTNLISEKKVKVYYVKKDGFGRVLGDVWIGRMNVNQEMVRRGLAWHYALYSDDETLKKLEQEARRKKIGLWSNSCPIPPWRYRARMKNKKVSANSTFKKKKKIQTKRKLFCFIKYSKHARGATSKKWAESKPGT